MALSATLVRNLSLPWLFRRSTIAWWGVALAVLAGVLSVGFGTAARADSARPPLFGSTETKATSLKAFRKWTGMLDRQVHEQTLYDRPCTVRAFRRCELPEWQALLAELKGRDKLAQIEAVNAFMNRAPYITDPVNYGLPDYWATPLQFLIKDGDCEDYAIAKFISLRTLGFANDDLRIVVVDDLNLGVPHAVLVVYVDGKAMVLDNQIPKVVRAETIRHYRPIFSINEEAWWLHKRR